MASLWKHANVSLLRHFLAQRFWKYIMALWTTFFILVKTVRCDSEWFTVKKIYTINFIKSKRFIPEFQWKNHSELYKSGTFPPKQALYLIIDLRTYGFGKTMELLKIDYWQKHCNKKKNCLTLLISMCTHNRKTVRVKPVSLCWSSAALCCIWSLRSCVYDSYIFEMYHDLGPKPKQLFCATTFSALLWEIVINFKAWKVNELVWREKNLKLQITGSYLLHIAPDACFDWLRISQVEAFVIYFAAAAQRQPLDLDADRKQDTL